MEDVNTLAGDCVVISCCCQCLILQIIIFVLLKLPYKLIQKMRNFAKKKPQQRKRSGEKILINMVGSELMAKYKNELAGVIGESIRIHADQSRFSFEGGYNSNCGCCMEEVEKVMEELSKRGEFGFGSFWSKEKEEPDELIFPTCLAKQEFDHDGRFVRYQLIEMVDSLSCS